jgi:Flp pilus assembly protein TadD
MRYSPRRPAWPVMLLILLGVTACSGSEGGVSIDRPVEDPIFGSLPAEKSIEIGRRYYQHGQYGLAEQSFRQAVEQDHNNAEAWLGLAASYDKLRRFDRAKQAYDVLVKLVGRTPVVLNNLGYHFFLSGDRVRARETLIAALRSDPENEQIRDNLALVAGERPASDWSPRISPAP